MVGAFNGKVCEEGQVSERKRLTDKEREGLLGLVHFNKPGDPIATRARAALEADYLQAREDVKRLASALRSLAPFHKDAGGDFCWCQHNEGPCFRSEDGAPTQQRCRTFSDLLSEVTTP